MKTQDPSCASTDQVKQEKCYLLVQLQIFQDVARSMASCLRTFTEGWTLFLGFPRYVQLRSTKLLILL